MTKISSYAVLLHWANCLPTTVTEVDCVKFIEQYEQRGPRPDYDDELSLMSDMPPEVSEAQYKKCEEELARIQQFEDQDQEINQQLYHTWILSNWDHIKITIDECDIWSSQDSNRGARPDVGLFKMDLSEPADEGKVFDMQSLSPALVDVFCEELIRREEAAGAREDVDGRVFFGDTTESPESLMTLTVADNDDEIFPKQMYQMDSIELVKDLTVCTKYPSVCCPLYTTTSYDSDVFSNETISALNNEAEKNECAKYEFMPCCVFAELCDVYNDLAHCQVLPELTEEAKLLFKPTSSSTSTTTTTTTTSTTTSTSTSTTSSSVSADETTPKPASTNTDLTDNPNSEKIVADEDFGEGPDKRNGESDDGRSATDEAEETEAKAARKGIIILIVVVALIALMSIGVAVSRHFYGGTDGQAIAAGEDDKLIVTNIPDGSTGQQLEQVPEEQEEEEQQTQQTQVQN